MLLSSLLSPALFLILPLLALPLSLVWASGPSNPLFLIPGLVAVLAAAGILLLPARRRPIDRSLVAFLGFSLLITVWIALRGLLNDQHPARWQGNLTRDLIALSACWAFATSTDRPCHLLALAGRWAGLSLLVYGITMLLLHQPSSIGHTWRNIGFGNINILTNMLAPLICMWGARCLLCQRWREGACWLLALLIFTLVLRRWGALLDLTLLMPLLVTARLPWRQAPALLCGGLLLSSLLLLGMLCSTPMHEALTHSQERFAVYRGNLLTALDLLPWGGGPYAALHEHSMGHDEIRLMLSHRLSTWHPHNIWLALLQDGGLPALCAGVAACVLTLRRLLHIRNPLDRSTAAVLVAGLIVHGATSMVSGTWPGLLFAGIAVGLIWRLPTNEPVNRASLPTGPLRWVLGGIFLLVPLRELPHFLASRGSPCSWQALRHFSHIEQVTHQVATYAEDADRPRYQRLSALTAGLQLIPDHHRWSLMHTYLDHRPSAERAQAIAAAALAALRQNPTWPQAYQNLAQHLNSAILEQMSERERWRLACFTGRAAIQLPPGPLARVIQVDDLADWMMVFFWYAQRPDRSLADADRIARNLLQAFPKLGDLHDLCFMALCFRPELRRFYPAWERAGLRIQQDIIFQARRLPDPILPLAAEILRQRRPRWWQLFRAGQDASALLSPDRKALAACTRIWQAEAALKPPATPAPAPE